MKGALGRADAVSDQVGYIQQVGGRMQYVPMLLVCEYCPLVYDWIHLLIHSIPAVTSIKVGGVSTWSPYHGTYQADLPRLIYIV